MFKDFFKGIFNEHSTRIAESNIPPVFKITESELNKTDFEVSELSYEEYVKFVCNERRRTSKPVAYERRSDSSVLHS